MLKLICYKSILHMLGIALLFESLFMLLIVPIAYYYNENTIVSELLSFGITFGLGFLLFSLTKKYHTNNFSIKESFIIIPHLWIIITLFGTLPYLLTHSIAGFIDSFFESVSGFTTTGSSIVSNIEGLPKSILFWRAATHWMGGLGIVVLVIAIMRHLKIGGNHLMMAEGSLLGIDKIKPRLFDVAKQLCYIYVVLTLIETIFLMMAGMGLFDAVCHSFATIATGGFSTKNTSAMEMSASIQYILTIFMILSGINFSLHYFLLQGKLKQVLLDIELKVYLAILAGITLFLTINTLSSYTSVEESFRHSLFQVSSIITCTGFSSADYELWPGFSHIIIFFTMFIGASVGSTGGGIKVARFVILFKIALQRFRTILSPNAIYISKYNTQKISNGTINSVFAFVSIYFLTFAFGTLVMTAAGNNMATAGSSIVTTLGGIGPGFGHVGPAENFFGLSAFSKFYLSINMILGRLEIFPVLILLIPDFRKV